MSLRAGLGKGAPAPEWPLREPLDRCMRLAVCGGSRMMPRAASAPPNTHGLRQAAVAPGGPYEYVILQAAGPAGPGQAEAGRTAGLAQRTLDLRRLSGAAAQVGRSERDIATARDRQTDMTE